MKRQAKKIFEGNKPSFSTYLPKKPNTLLLVAILVGVALVVSAGLILWNTQDSSSVVVSVNGEEITSDYIDSRWDSLPVQTKLQLGRDQLVKDIVDSRLLLQEAKSRGMVTSDAEVKQMIEEQLLLSNSSLSEFKNQLSAQGMDFDMVLDQYREQITIQKLIKDSADPTLFNFTMEERKDYYTTNKESFYQPPTVTVKHILIEVNNETNKSTSLELAVEINDSLEQENNSNFCGLVNEYSMDVASRNNCGEYTFGRGEMVASFENASFTMDQGERQIVESPFGFHIILKENSSEGRYIGFNETIPVNGREVVLQEYISSIMAQESMFEVYESLAQRLRDNATIVYYASVNTTNSTAMTDVVLNSTVSN
ncbi:MAG: peptidylprolyl isomerase [Nanobdellota archaeon]